MGLNIVEMFIDFEEAFGIRIPDERAGQMPTGRDVVQFVLQMPVAPSVGCMTQRIFYRIRRGIWLLTPGWPALTPDTPLREITTREVWPALWSGVRRLAKSAEWPERVPWKGVLRPGPATIRELTLHVAMQLPPPDPARGEVWTRDQVELAVRRVIWKYACTLDFSLGDHFVRDLGLD